MRIFNFEINPEIKKRGSNRTLIHIYVYYIGKAMQNQNVLNPFIFKKMAVFHRVNDEQHSMGGF